jgi:hypothetical protein
MAIHRNLDINVKVPVAKLIEALISNKAKHLEDYSKAVTVYFRDMQELLSNLTYQSSQLNLSQDYTIKLHKPVNNEKLYDKYIGMFQMTVDDTIEISAEEYGCIVDDNWDWAASAVVANSFYSSKY